MGSRWLRLALLAAVALAVLLLWRSGVLDQFDLANLKARQLELQAWAQGQPWLAAAIFAAIYVFATALSLPGAAILTLAAGAIFGFAIGVAIVSISSTLGATLAFLASRFLFRNALRERYGSRLRTFEDGVERDGAFYLFSLRLLPVFPFFLINLLAGLTNLRTWTFAWVSLVGMLPGTLAYVYAGTQLSRIQAPADILSARLLLAFALLAALPWLMRLLVAWLKARRAYRGFRKPRKFDYNLAVIGAGSAGLVTSYIAAAVGAKAVLVERGRMGGDCLNTGCVPSKALIRSARAAHEARHADAYGLSALEPEVDFKAVMGRVRHAIDTIAPHDSVERYERLGVDVVRGDARLVSPWEVAVGDRTVSARAIVVATGGTPTVPPIPGLDQGPYLTSDNLWDLEALPGRLLVLGGGPIGCELAQAFARLGSRVVLVEMGERLLAKEDLEASDLLQARFEQEGIELRLGCRAQAVEWNDGRPRVSCVQDDAPLLLEGDRLLVALGRTPDTEGLGADELGIVMRDRGGVETDAFMRTNFPNILVAGDVAGQHQFTHVASHHAWHAAVNALLSPWWKFRMDTRVIPWATFTSPEVARVGLSESEAQAQGIEFETTCYDVSGLDRAIADGQALGFVKVLTPPGKDRILGVTIVAEHAAELIAEFVLAMRHGLGLGKILSTIHIYPTLNEANRNAAAAWKRAHAPQRLLAAAGRYFDWRRG